MGVMGRLNNYCTTAILCSVAMTSTVGSLESSASTSTAQASDWQCFAEPHGEWFCKNSNAEQKYQHSLEKVSSQTVNNISADSKPVTPQIPQSEKSNNYVENKKTQEIIETLQQEIRILSEVLKTKNKEKTILAKAEQTIPEETIKTNHHIENKSVSVAAVAVNTAPRASSTSAQSEQNAQRPESDSNTMEETKAVVSNVRVVQNKTAPSSTLTTTSTSSLQNTAGSNQQKHKAVSGGEKKVTDTDMDQVFEQLLTQTFSNSLSAQFDTPVPISEQNSTSKQTIFGKKDNAAPVHPAPALTHPTPALNNTMEPNQYMDMDNFGVNKPEASGFSSRRQLAQALMSKQMMTESTVSTASLRNIQNKYRQMQENNHQVISQKSQNQTQPQSQSQPLPSPAYEKRAEYYPPAVAPKKFIPPSPGREISYQQGRTEAAEMTNFGGPQHHIYDYNYNESKLKNSQFSRIETYPQAQTIPMTENSGLEYLYRNHANNSGSAPALNNNLGYRQDAIPHNKPGAMNAGDILNYTQQKQQSNISNNGFGVQAMPANNNPGYRQDAISHNKPGAISTGDILNHTQQKQQSNISNNGFGVQAMPANNNPGYRQDTVSHNKPGAMSTGDISNHTQQKPQSNISNNGFSVQAMPAKDNRSTYTQINTGDKPLNSAERLQFKTREFGANQSAPREIQKQNISSARMPALNTLHSQPGLHYQTASEPYQYPLNQSSTGFTGHAVTQGLPQPPTPESKLKIGQYPSHYITLQWSSSINKMDLIQIKQRYPQLINAEIITQIQRGNTEYVLVDGIFENMQMALTSLRQPHWRHLTVALSPWARTIGSIIPQHYSATDNLRNGPSIINHKAQAPTYPNGYTIQWAKSNSIEFLQSIKATYPALMGSRIVPLSRFQKIVYVLISGQYPDRLSAMDATSHPPLSALVNRLQPRARPIASLGQAAAELNHVPQQQVLHNR